MKHLGFNILAGEQTGGGYFVQVNENMHYFDKDSDLDEDARILWAIMEELGYSTYEAEAFFYPDCE